MKDTKEINTVGLGYQQTWHPRMLLSVDAFYRFRDLQDMTQKPLLVVSGAVLSDEEAHYSLLSSQKVSITISKPLSVNVCDFWS